MTQQIEDPSQAGPILRLFEVRARACCVDTLKKKFATTSADVVRGQPGNMGYFFGSLIENHDNGVIFASVWDNLEAVRARFGVHWQSSFLPPGYEELIEECSVRHFDLSDGWQLTRPK